MAIRLFFSTLILLISFPGFAFISKVEVNNSVDELDKALDSRNSFITQREARIDSLKSLLQLSTNDERNLNLLLQIGESYKSFNNDSALISFKRGWELADKKDFTVYANRFKMQLASIMPLAGYNSEAVELFNRVDKDELSEAYADEYYDAGRQMYSYIASSFSKYPETYARWNKHEIAYRDSLLSVLKPGSDLYDLNYSEKLIDEGRISQAKTMLINLLSRLSPTSNIYARASHKLASIAIENGDRGEQIYYLALSSTADTKGAVREVMALQELGNIFFEEGDVERAFQYLNIALSNAVECGASMRINQASIALPIIQEAHNRQIKSWRQRIELFIGILALVMLIFIVVLIKQHRQKKAMIQLQKRLKDANLAKEIYISQFFRLCSIYIDRLNQFCNTANRKISAGQVDEFYKMVKSGKIIEEQNKEFYSIFDDAFLHIYPTFVDDVNELLREKVVLKEGERLNNDLRMLAFMRLGLEDTNQVALILNYSVNTVYAYRNKFRNRAYDRENFERNIMNIGSI